MNKYTGYICKLFLFILLESFTIIKDEGKKKSLYVIAGLSAVFLILVMVYFYIRSEQYRTTFLRKTYKPSTRLLSFVFTVEIMLTIGFYAMIGDNWLYMGIQLLFLVVIDFLLFYHHSSRKTVQLEKNEEFFKICFLQQDYKEESVLCLKKGELVQVVDKRGEKIEVRRSDGKKFIVPLSIVDDKLDLYL